MRPYDKCTQSSHHAVTSCYLSFHIHRCTQLLIPAEKIPISPLPKGQPQSPLAEAGQAEARVPPWSGGSRPIPAG